MADEWAVSLTTLAATRTFQRALELKASAVRVGARKKHGIANHHQ